MSEPVGRVHIDLDVPDLAAAIERVLGLGGSIVSEERELRDARWRVMADPEGNEFCLALDG